MRAYFLDLSGLLFQLRVEGLHPHLLLGHYLLQFFKFLVLFEGLIEQHGVDLVVMDSCDFTILAMRHEMRIEFGFSRLGDLAIQFGGFFRRTDRICQHNMSVKPAG